MSNNPNFHNKGGRPIFNRVYEGDETLCFDNEKSRALLGYFSTSPYAEKVSIDDYDNGWVLLKLNDKRAVIQVSSSLRRIVIGKANELGEIQGSFYNYEFYLRHTIDYLIIEATEHIVEMLEIEGAYKLWSKF